MSVDRVGTGLNSPRVTCNIFCMPTSPNDRSVSQRVADYRKRMKEQGMRPIQLWVTDVRAPGFAPEAHRQAVAVTVSGHADDDQAFIDALSLDDK